MSEPQRRAGRPLVPLIPIDEAGLGPAMLDLSPAMRAFVVAKVQNGCSNADAAKQAGYSDTSRHSLEVQGSRLAHDERIQMAILEEGQKLMRAEGPRSIKTLVEIRDSTWLETKDRLKAAVELLNRSGFSAVTQHNVNVEHHHMSDADKDRRIIALCQELGLGEDVARKMLIAPDKIIDADFAEVQPVSPEVAAKRDHKNELRRQRKNMTPEELAAHKAQKREERSKRGKAKYNAANDAALQEILGPLATEAGEIP